MTVATRLARSPALWLGLIVLVAFAVAVRYVLGFSNYVIMSDELGYMKQAVHLAETLTPSTNGEMWFNSSAQLGPLLFAPAYGLLDTPAAFDVSHVLAAAAFVSTAVPVYLLARDVVEERVAALLAAALSIAVPWLGMSASLMSETVAYPASAWALLAMTRAVAAPSPRRDLVALAAILLATLGRTQLIVLAGALAAAVVLHTVLYGRGLPGARRPRNVGRALLDAGRGHVVLVATGVLAGVLALSGVSGLSVLGSYAGPAGGDILPAGALAAGREMLAYVAIGAGALPLALAIAWGTLTLLAPRTRVAHAFAAVGLCVSLVLIVVAGSFTVRYAPAINDRYLFFLVPVLMVGTMGLLFERRPATIALVVAAVIAGAVIAASDLAQSGPSLVSPSQIFHTVLDGRTSQVRAALGLGSLTAATLVAVLVVVATLALAIMRRRLPAPRLGLVCAVGVLAVGVAQTGYALDRLGATQAGVSQAFLDGRDWLDREAPGNAPIGLVLGTVFEPAVSPAVWWDVSFWSKRADRVWVLPRGDHHGQNFKREAAIDPMTGTIPALDERELLVLSVEERRFELRGQKAVAGRNGVMVVRATRPYRAAWTLQATTEESVIAVDRAGRLRIYADGRGGPRRMTVTVTSSPGAPRGYYGRLVVDGRGERVPVNIGTTERLSTPITLPPTGFTDVRLEVSDPLPGTTPDPDAGLKVLAVQVRR